MFSVDGLLGARITYVLGISNLLGLALVFFSCRCLVGTKFVQTMLQHDWYKKFYNTHCWFWRFFFISVFLHVVFAIYSFGNPF